MKTLLSSASIVDFEQVSVCWKGLIADRLVKVKTDFLMGR